MLNIQMYLIMALIKYLNMIMLNVLLKIKIMKVFTMEGILTLSKTNNYVSKSPLLKVISTKHLKKFTRTLINNILV